MECVGKATEGVGAADADDDVGDVDEGLGRRLDELDPLVQPASRRSQDTAVECVLCGVDARAGAGRVRGEDAKFDDAFAPFSVAFLPTFLAGIVFSLLIAAGFALCVIPGLVFLVLWTFTWPLLMDKRLDFWPAMELSRKVLWPNFWGMLGFLIVSLCVLTLGVICCYVGIFVAYPVVLAAQACAYEDFFGRTGQPVQPAPSVPPSTTPA